MGKKRRASTFECDGSHNGSSKKGGSFGQRIFGPEDIVEVSKEFLSEVDAAEERMNSTARKTRERSPKQVEVLVGTLESQVPKCGERRFSEVVGADENMLESDMKISLGRRPGKEHVVRRDPEWGKLPSWNLLDEVEMYDGVGRVGTGAGDVMRAGLQSSEPPNWDEIEEEMSVGVEQEVSESDIRCRGYDTDFWAPLVNDVFGGSNAIDIMCPTDLGVVSGSSESGDVGNGMEEGTGAPFAFNLNDAYCGACSSPTVCSPICGQASGGCGKRKLDDVQDEEFDVEPLFDNRTFARAAIPDLDREDEEDEIFVGKTFMKKLDCQIALAIYAIKNMFYFKQTRTKRNYFVVSCADTNCGWRVSAGETKDNCYYQIKKAELHHTCGIETRRQYKKLASFKVIGEIFRTKFGDADGGPKLMDIQQLLLEELRISCSYSKCWKARGSANEENRGTEENGYLYLLQYLHMLKEANPGKIADIETVDDGYGGERFLYLFLAFGASISGFKWLRRVLVIDGTHLTGKYKGLFLTASGQDANFQVFPLAFAVVDSEREESWSWFLKKLKDEIIADSPELTIISDWAPSITKSVKFVYPKSKHGACIVHVARNVVSHYKSKGLSKLVTEAAFAYKVSDFNLLFGKVKSSSLECVRYLEKKGLASWSRVYFQGNRYNMMTSNIAESLNNALWKGKQSPITELLMFIQSMLSRWFGARAEKARKHMGLVTPEVDKVITKNLAHVKATKVTALSSWRYEVIGEFGGRYNVELRDKVCTYKLYTKIKIPCGHALIAAGLKEMSYNQLCGDYYWTSAWRKTYAGVVQPHEDPKEGEIPEDVLNRIIKPPKTRRPAGRPKHKRIQSTGDILKGGSSKSSSNKCSRCKKTGHNKTSCKEVI